MSAWSPLRFEKIEDADTGAVVFRLDGALTETPEGFALLEAVRQRLQDKPAPILLNMAKVEVVTSAGVGIIASCHTSALGKGASVGLVQLSPRARAILNLVRLLTVIPAYESEQEALAKLRAGKAVP
jgi:anti-anti-sigma factor